MGPYADDDLLTGFSRPARRQPSVRAFFATSMAAVLKTQHSQDLAGRIGSVSLSGQHTADQVLSSA
jgi:hypothetical protein